MRDTKNRHAECLKLIEKKPGHGERPSKRRELQKEFHERYHVQGLALLQTCRQVYVEASAILWRTTTWSFISRSYHDRGMQMFLSARTAHQRSLMRQVHIHYHEPYAWDALSESLIKKFDSTTKGFAD